MIRFPRRESLNIEGMIFTSGELQMCAADEETRAMQMSEEMDFIDY